METPPTIPVLKCMIFRNPAERFLLQNPYFD